MKESKGMLRNMEAQSRPLRMSQQVRPAMMQYGTLTIRSLVTPKKLVGTPLETPRSRPKWWF